MLLDNDSDGQVFVLDVAYEIGIIVVDPDAHIISRNNSVVLGTDAYLTNASLIVYPNPANDQLYLQNLRTLPSLKSHFTTCWEEP